MEQKSKNKNNTVVVLIAITVIVIGLFGIIYLLNKNTYNAGGSGQSKLEVPINNVSIKDGKQIVEISAKAGYFPVKSIAKAGLPTILKIKTKGTYDCSTALRIPSLNISKNLPGSGETEIDIGVQEVGQFVGTCSMGMYSFTIDFQN